MMRAKNYYKERNGYSRITHDPVGISEIAPLLTILVFGIIISLFVLLLECFSNTVLNMRLGIV